MKILFIHLSDAHLKQDTPLRDINTNALVDSLSQMGNFDECVLVFSGDIANSGNENEYKVAGKMFGRILKGISDKYLGGKKHIHTFVVPGNHDNLMKNEKRNYNAIKSYYLDKKLDEHYYEDLDELNNFFEFAKRNMCYLRNKNIGIRTISFGTFKIRVNLINSAPFSIKGSDNGDKGLHYIPNRELSALDLSREENYTISIIHHSPEWFSEESKKALYNKLYESTDLLFVGHEHFSLNETKTVNGKSIDISSGVALYGTKTEHGFNALILDTKNNTLVSHKYIYNGKIYKPSVTPVLENKNVVFKSKNQYSHTLIFKRFLETDTGQRAGENYMDYFVFPALEAKNMNSELNAINVSTEEKFMELFNKYPKISIEGGLNAGKTTLAKYLCTKLSDDYIPLLLNEEDFGTKNNKNVIKYALEEQYGPDADYDEYIQADKDKLVLIVDRNDRINSKRWSSFYEEYEEIFGHIILLCSGDWNINITEKALEELTEKSFIYFKISPFYYAKREELITKVCRLFPERKIVDLTDTVRRINEEITNQIKYFQLTPDFIHQYVNYYLNFSFMKTQNDNNVFNKVFEANITFRIAQNTQQENVNEIMVALDFVAHHIHFNKKYPLPTEEFVEAVNKYNEKYDNTLEPKLVYNVALQSKIIKEIPDKFGIEFCNNNLLAYFTALHLNRLINEGKGKEELDYILTNVCFQINGDILLFLSYITSNVKILNPIMNSMIELMEEWNEFNFDDKEIKFLTVQTMPYVKPKLPDKEEKVKEVQKKTEAEKTLVEEKQPDAESLYSYDESKVNSFGNKISKALTYLDLVAKILPNFRHILDGNDKREVVSKLYTYPNKLLYFMLKDIDDNIDRIIDDILAANPKTKKGMLITKDMLTKSVQAQAMAYILTIYDFVACTATAGKGMEELNRLFSYEDNTNYILQNIMMEENYGNFQAFSKKAEKLYDKTGKEMIKQMVSMVGRKYFLNHEVALTGNAQKLADKFFGKDVRKDLQITQAKNRLVKK